MQTITFEELNKNTCLRFTHDSDQVMVTFLQADICLIAAADKQKFITDMQVVIERYAQRKRLGEGAEHKTSLGLQMFKF